MSKFKKGDRVVPVKNSTLFDDDGYSKRFIGITGTIEDTDGVMIYGVRFDDIRYCGYTESDLVFEPIYNTKLWNILK